MKEAVTQARPGAGLVTMEAPCERMSLRLACDGVAAAVMPPSTWLLEVTGPFCTVAAAARTSARLCVLTKVVCCSGALSAPAAKALTEARLATAIRAEVKNFVFMMKILLEK